MADFSIKDKVAVITGGSGVLGSNIAEGFAKAGAKMVIIGRTEHKVEEVVNKLKSLNTEVMGLTCDVLDNDALKKAADDILEKFGSIDILVNAAGGNTSGATLQPDQEVFDLKPDNLDEALNLNLNGTIYPSLIFGKVMAKKGSGSIINVSSMAAYSAITRVPAYTVAKSGINGFTQWLACEMAHKYGDKVRVNAIAPGFFIGEQNRKLLIKENGELTERSEKIINKTPMGRFGDITELNGIVQFLCSDAASFITGAVIPVDGGFNAFSGV
ncbi:SDR family oxidoreductase [Fulvivirga sediminis]|uniref:SDR family oxidoreductase n=1 Tax=Fulvivirga sediminis TaxID=2803949 RepID=A0A937F8H6_9BACT|nr:SDR family oxidoreductase [Fulvivirga sediminis]MBL3656224.1 SDR family oxidoreductase [Fulvivirga sediminis]